MTKKNKCCILCSRRLLEPFFKAVSQASFTYHCYRTLLCLQSTDCFWCKSHTFNRMMYYLITIKMWEISSLFIFLKDQLGIGEDKSVHYICLLDFTGGVLCRALCVQKIKNTATCSMKLGKKKCLPSTANNTRRMPLCCKLLSRMHGCYWWTIWTFKMLRRALSTFLLIHGFLKSVYIFWDTVFNDLCFSGLS